MPFSTKDWQDSPSTSTPLSAAALEDLEQRVTDYSDDYANSLVGDTAVVADSTLTATADATDTTITVSEVEPGGFVAVQAFSSSCEIRRISSVAGDVITLSSALGLDHASGSRVLYFQDSRIPVAWFGVSGSGSDEEVGLQAAFDQAAALNLCVDGGSRTITVDRAIIWPPGMQLAHMTIKAKSTFAPAETDNALVMNSQRVRLTFTAAASTDIITATAHGLPATDQMVIFKTGPEGGTLPTGITAGKTYYCRDRTTNTFKVSETEGGSAVNITADGTGVVWCEVISLQKVYVDDVMLDGNDVASLNGAFLYLQQQSELYKFRVDNCPGTGLHLIGQQAVFVNFESVDCGKSLVLDAASYMYFYGFNAESWTTDGVYISTAAASPVPGSTGGAFACGFWGVHLECNDSGTAVAFNLEGSCHEITIDNVNFSANTNGSKLVYCHTGDAASSSYQLRNVRFVTGGAFNRPTAIDDDDRGISLDSWDDYRHHIQEFSAPLEPAADAHTDPNGFMIAGVDGRYIKYGGVNHAIPSMEFRPSTVQATQQLSHANAQTVWRDGSGNAVTWVDARGVLTTQQNSEPDTYYLSAGQVYWWFDDTPGSAKVKFRGKNSSGTVVSGEVALS